MSLWSPFARTSVRHDKGLERTRSTHLVAGPRRSIQCWTVASETLTTPRSKWTLLSSMPVVAKAIQSR